MKAVNTKNGNIKLTLDATQAGQLLSILYEACFLASVGAITEEMHSTAHDLWEVLEGAGVEALDVEETFH
jgi:hypothetical protein